MQHTILSFDEIDSTNTYLKREYASLKDLTVVTAKHQTAGKGRRGRAWEDDGCSLVFSLVLKEDVPDERISLLPLLAGLAMSDTLLDYGIENQIKWPNDVMVQDKKVLGILLESIYQEKREALIIGIGVNVSQKAFPDELKEKAISLLQATGKEYDKTVLLQCFLHHFDCCYGMFLQGDDSYLDKIRSRFYLKGKTVYLNYYGEDKHVKVLDINNDGTLLVEENGKTYSLHSGEVTLEKNYHLCNPL